MSSNLKTLQCLLCVSVFLVACGGQKELIQMVQKTQDELKQCQSQTTEAKIKARVSVERQKDLESKLKNQQEEQVLEQELWKKKLQALSQLKTHPNPNVSHNLRNLNPDQIMILVKAVGGDIKRFGDRLMAIFGKIKAQIAYSRKDRVLTAHARFKGYTNDLKFINDWNRTKRFSRAYIDKDQDIVLEAEIDLEPGMSEEAIKNWLKGFGVILNFFQHNLVKQGRSKEHKSSPKLERHSI